MEREENKKNVRRLTTTRKVLKQEKKGERVKVLRTHGPVQGNQQVKGQMTRAGVTVRGAVL